MTKSTNREGPVPGETPHFKLFVPIAHCSILKRWAHATLRSGHLGITDPLSLITYSFSWSSIKEDVTSFVMYVFAQVKSSHL